MENEIDLHQELVIYLFWFCFLLQRRLWLKFSAQLEGTICSRKHVRKTSVMIRSRFPSRVTYMSTSHLVSQSSWQPKFFQGKRRTNHDSVSGTRLWFCLLTSAKNKKRPRGINYGHIFSVKHLRGYNKKMSNNFPEKRASTVSPILYFGISPNHQCAVFVQVDFKYIFLRSYQNPEQCIKENFIEIMTVFCSNCFNREQ